MRLAHSPTVKAVCISYNMDIGDVTDKGRGEKRRGGRGLRSDRGHCAGFDVGRAYVVQILVWGGGAYFHVSLESID